MSVIVGRAAKGKKDRRDAAGVATYTRLDRFAESGP